MQPLPATIVIAPPTGLTLYTDFPTLLSSAIVLVFTVASLLVLIMLLLGGIQWILSGGDKEKVGAARSRIMHALIGLAILALAFVIVNVIGALTGINPLNLRLPTPSNPAPSAGTTPRVSNPATGSRP